MDHDVSVAMVDPGTEWWTTSDVAAFLGVQVGTVSSYRQRGQMPQPDQTLGRTHLWRPATIRRWHEGRPRLGSGDSPTPTLPSSAREDDESRWIAHGERPVYDNEWVRLSLVDVEPPGGERFEHHVVTLKPAAMVAILDEDDRNVLLMWRHRFVSDVWNWELVGGVVEAGEDPAETVKREALEETGYRLGYIEHLVTFEPMIGMVRSQHHVFLARGAVKVAEPTETTEMQRMEWIPLDGLRDRLDAGEIVNSGTLVALLYVLAFWP